MSIYLVRHGQTVGNRDRIMQVEDTPLSPLGARQAERLAVRLAEVGVARIVSSDLARARATAETVAALTQVPLVLEPLLRERDFGALRALPYSELPCDPFALDYVPPQGESWGAFHERVAHAFAWLCAERRAAAGNLVVVTHGLVLRAVLDRHVPNPHVGSAWELALDNTGVTELAAEPPYEPRAINCCTHLHELNAELGHGMGARA